MSTEWKKPVSVAIDGPVGAGKSTIARAVAERMGFIYCDTGALYRSVGLFCVRDGACLDSPCEIVERLADINLKIRLVDGVQRVFLNGEDVSDKIRTADISTAASKVSAVPEVRAALLGIQRDIAKTENVIMDGRDIGTVVLPNADVKIYLTASAEVRAKRRYDERISKGAKVTYEETLKDVNERDYRDMHREAAPLKRADDAVKADTSELDFSQSVELVCGIIRKTIE